MVKDSQDQKLAEYVKQINGAEEAILGRNMLEMFWSRVPAKCFQDVGKVWITLIFKQVKFCTGMIHDPEMGHFPVPVLRG